MTCLRCARLGASGLAPFQRPLEPASAPPGFGQIARSLQVVVSA
ncbi:MULTISPECIES: hypothetical protein [unclassified Methylobacterium]|nr:MULTISPECIES: hypothetical protein [unclassified Methylobacterium]